MAETSHKALEAVNGANVEELLVKVLDGREVLGLSVAVAAGTSPHPHAHAQQHCQAGLRGVMLTRMSSTGNVLALTG